MDFDNTGKPRRFRMEELCQTANLSRSTIYLYLRAGLLHPPLNEGPTQVRYDDTHLKRLEKIRYLRKEKKMSISKIQKMLKVEAPKKIDPNDTSSQLKNLIFEKAIELFSTNGFAKVKITDITDALNLGKGTFYLYFKSKEELVLECIERFPEIILPANAWEEVRKERNYFRRTHKRLLFMLEAFPTFMGIISIAKLGLRGDDPNMAKKATECFQTIINATAKDLKWAIKEGSVRDIDKEFISFITFGMAESLGYWLIMNPNDSIKERADTMLDYVTNGIAKKNSTNLATKIKEAINDAVQKLEYNQIQLKKIALLNKPDIEEGPNEGKQQIDTEKSNSIESKRQKIESDQTTARALRPDETIKIKIEIELASQI